MGKAVVLLSGGVDSAVTLYIARVDHECHVLIFDYGQRARKEITFARRIAEEAGTDFQVLEVPMPWKGSSLLDDVESVPDGEASAGGRIPSTYVPARNIVFLSLAVSFAEAIGAEAVFIGAHQMDFSNYPDCRGEFFESFRKVCSCGTKTGVEKRPIRIETPVIDKTKKEIIETGHRLGVPFKYTWSCYVNGEEPCLRCESCLFRARAFKAAGIADPGLKT